MIKTIVTPDGCQHVQMTAGEISARQAEETANVTAAAAQELKSNARAALEKSDMTALRCLKAEVEFPQSWKDYVSALRLIVSGGAGPLPVRPDYPEGT